MHPVTLCCALGCVIYIAAQLCAYYGQSVTPALPYVLFYACLLLVWSLVPHPQDDASTLLITE